jgi:prephenate dehydratase
MPEPISEPISDTDPDRLIAFQGYPGANSDIAAREARPGMTPYPCRTFEDAFEAVLDGRCALAMIPIDNTVAGRVADVHHLLPGSGLHIVGEHYLRINHQLLALPGTDEATLTHVHSHVHALHQCRKIVRALGLEAVVHDDTAGAARDVAEAGDPTQASISSALAAEVYGLDILRTNIEDDEHNVTRFVLLSRTPQVPSVDVPSVVSFVFWVRHVPAALYKALGGFATNGVNMTKLESGIGGGFIGAHFYAEVEGHPDQRPLKLAMDELNFFSQEVRVLGVYPQHAFRMNGGRF